MILQISHNEECDSARKAKVLIQFDTQPAIMPEETSRNMYSNTTYENCRIESDSGYVTLHPNYMPQLTTLNSRV